MSAIIKKVVAEPAKIVKKTVKSLAEPASKSESPYKIAVGVALSPVISWGYGKFYDFIMGFLPNLPSWAKTLIKLGLPLLPTPLIYKFKIPAGAVINGGLFGVFFLQLIQFVYELITGKTFSLKSISNTSVDTAVSADTTDFGVF